VNQKVSARNIVVTDVVNDITDGVLLINLLEVLSERELPGALFDAILSILVVSLV